MRTFLSYDIEEASVLAKVRDFQNGLGNTGADLKFVRPEILHFTIRFLGEIDEAVKEKIIEVLEDKVPPLNLEVKFRGIGTFPSEKRISVIWIGSDEVSGKKFQEQARIINSRLDQELQNLPGEKDNRFNPHVTIARVRTGRNKEELVRFLQEHKDQDFGSAKIGKLKLKLSELRPEGPQYSDLHEFT